MCWAKRSGENVTLTTRLSVFFLSILAFVLVGFSLALYVLADRYLHHQVDERLGALIDTISGLIEASPLGVEWEPETRYQDLYFSLLHGELIWMVADPEGRIVGQSNQGIEEQFLRATSASLRPKSQPIGISNWSTSEWNVSQRSIYADDRWIGQGDHSRMDDVERINKFPALSITVGASLKHVQRLLRNLALTLAGLSIGIWVIALVTGRFVCQRALRPLNLMATAIREVNADELDHHRIPVVASNDELEDLNRSFNSLLDRLHEAFEKQRRFTGDASHQLRTPLTAILGQIEVALRRERSQSDYQGVLNKVYQRAHGLSQVVESLLFLARDDAETQPLAFERLNLNDWLMCHATQYSDHPRANDLQWRTGTVAGCFVDVHSPLLGELVNILIDNACKFSEPGSAIRIDLASSATNVFLTIVDHGFGIEEVDIATIFDPFSRSEEARRRGIDGVGLGLSIAMRLAETLHGDLTVTSHPGEGSCFTLQLRQASQIVNLDS